MTVRLATAPVSWGVDFADAPGNPPWRHVLDAIGQSGFEWLELGPVGYLPEDPAELRARGLRACGSFVFQPLHDPARLPEILRVTRRTCRAIAAAGGRHLVVIDLVAPERERTAGRADAARRLTLHEWDALVAGVRAVGAVAEVEFGLRPVFHPHAGSFVEFADEIERLLTAVPRIGLCLDTGHSAYAGIDPVELYERFADRVTYLHLKDVDPGVVAQGLPFWEAIAAGVFCRVGSGAVDFAGLARAMARHGFDGWATMEQDRVAGNGDPLADVRAGREFLREVGLT